MNQKMLLWYSDSDQNNKWTCPSYIRLLFVQKQCILLVNTIISVLHWLETVSPWIQVHKCNVCQRKKKVEPLWSSVTSLIGLTQCIDPVVLLSCCCVQLPEADTAWMNECDDGRQTPENWTEPRQAEMSYSRRYTALQRSNKGVTWRVTGWIFWICIIWGTGLPCQQNLR